MNRLFLIIVITALALLTYQETSIAVCTEGPPDTFTCDTADPNPDLTGVQELGNNNDLTVNMLQGSGIDTLNGNGGDAIALGQGGFLITLTGADINGDDDGIDTGAGGATGSGTINITDSSINAINDGIEVDGGSSVLTILNSSITTDNNDGIEISGDSDSEITITGSVITAGGDAIDGAGTDIITIEDSTITGESSAISVSTGDDIITFKTNAEINGEIRCSVGFDTLVFAMEVPEELLNFYSNQITLATVPDGSVTINGLTYVWTGCELLVNELVGVRITRPIPTLSQWGMIVMAGLIGIVGFIAVRKRALA